MSFNRIRALAEHVLVSFVAVAMVRRQRVLKYWASKVLASEWF